MRCAMAKKRNPKTMFGMLMIGGTVCVAVFMLIMAVRPAPAQRYGRSRRRPNSINLSTAI
jgi:hypothetical protein